MYNTPLDSLLNSGLAGRRPFDIISMISCDGATVDSAIMINDPTSLYSLDIDGVAVLTNVHIDDIITYINNLGLTSQMLQMNVLDDLNPFDFAIIRYSWTSINGQDLDTRTSITTPPRNIIVGVGASRSNMDSTYLTWCGDNTSSFGSEAVLVDFNALSAAYPEVENIVIQMAGNWYSSRADGYFTVQFATYLGGTMTPSGYDFVNTGGVLVDSTSVIVNVTSQINDDVLGDSVGTLRYNTANKTAQIIAI